MNKSDKDILKSSLEYLYWFSRFEFTLKQNKYYIVNNGYIRPYWKKYIKEYQDKYQLSDDAKKLLELKPKKEAVDNDKNLYWEDIRLEEKNSDLDKVVLCLKTVRNNLFHGGKHHSQTEVEKKRDLDLINSSIKVIIELANLNSFGGETFEPRQGFNLRDQLFCK